MTVILTPGQRNEATVFERLLEQGAVRRPGRGRPRLRPRRVVGDKGYTGRRYRAYCRRRGIRYTIAKLRTEHHTGPFDRTVYRRRNHVERLIGRCKQYRSLATRYEKRAQHYHALWLIAVTSLWIKQLH
jgi:transposase